MLDAMCGFVYNGDGGRCTHPAFLKFTCEHGHEFYACGETEHIGRVVADIVAQDKAPVTTEEY